MPFRSVGPRPADILDVNFYKIYVNFYKIYVNFHKIYVNFYKIDVNFYKIYVNFYKILTSAEAYLRPTGLGATPQTDSAPSIALFTSHLHGET